MFELAAQAEITTYSSYFLRFTERIRQEGRPPNNAETGNSRQPFPRPREGGNIQQWHGREKELEHEWPLFYETTGDSLREHQDRRNSNYNDRPHNRKRTQLSAEQAAWLRKRPCLICDKTGHLLFECPKKKASGCLRCGKDYRLRECPSRLRQVSWVCRMG